MDKKHDCALDVLVDPANGEDGTPHEDLRIFINICKGVHGVGACEECFNHRGGKCGFLRAADIASNRTDVAEA